MIAYLGVNLFSFHDNEVNNHENKLPKQQKISVIHLYRFNCVYVGYSGIKNRFLKLIHFIYSWNILRWLSWLVYIAVTNDHIERIRLRMYVIENILSFRQTQFKFFG